MTLHDHSDDGVLPLALVNNQQKNWPSLRISKRIQLHYLPSQVGTHWVRRKRNTERDRKRERERERQSRRFYYSLFLQTFHILFLLPATLLGWDLGGDEGRGGAEAHLTGTFTHVQLQSDWILPSKHRNIHIPNRNRSTMELHNCLLLRNSQCLHLHLHLFI